MLILLEIGLGAMPMGVWYRYGFSHSTQGRERWQQMRRGLIAFFIPASAGALWLLIIAIQEHVWGLVPCFLGIQLIAIGYMTLAKRAEPAQSVATPPRRANQAATQFVLL
jgi:hypothetical protein